MLPTKFADDDIPVIRKRIAYFDWVITALDIVLPVLLVFCRDKSRVQRVTTVRHGITRFRLVMKSVMKGVLRDNENDCNRTEHRWFVHQN